MNYLDSFSGIGGFALGAYRAGLRFDTHYFSEVDPWAVELYQRRFPDAIPLGDIKEIDCGQLPSGDWVLTGGFPCQDISTAGERAGIVDGVRSSLWFTMRDIIRSLRPRIVIAENVAAITFRGLGNVINSLSSIGYDCEWQNLPAALFGAPHRRNRIYIVAYPSSKRGNNVCRQPMQRWRVMADSFQIESSANWNGVRYQRERQAYRNGGVLPSRFRRVDDGLPQDVDRLRGLGNAIVPQIAELIFRQIRPLIEASYDH